jgi:hypothetical protein
MNKRKRTKEQKHYLQSQCRKLKMEPHTEKSFKVISVSENLSWTSSIADTKCDLLFGEKEDGNSFQ